MLEVLGRSERKIAVTAVVEDLSEAAGVVGRSRLIRGWAVEFVGRSLVDAACQENLDCS